MRQRHGRQMRAQGGGFQRSLRAQNLSLKASSAATAPPGPATKVLHCANSKALASLLQSSAFSFSSSCPATKALLSAFCTDSKISTINPVVYALCWSGALALCRRLRWLQAGILQPTDSCKHALSAALPPSLLHP